MGTTDRTDDLRAAFDAALVARRAASTDSVHQETQPSTAKCTRGAPRSDTSSSPSPSLSFLKALASMSVGCDQLQRETDRVVRSALTTMDEVLLGSTTDLESQIRETIASGVSLGATVAEFLASVDAALTVEREVVMTLRDRRQAEEIEDDDNAMHVGGRSSSFIGSVQRVARRAEEWVFKSASRTSLQKRNRAMSSCLDALEHCRVGGEILQAVVVEEKLRLALCEEELELFKKDLFVLGRGGVLSGVDDAVRHFAGPGGNTDISGGDEAEQRPSHSVMLLGAKVGAAVSNRSGHSAAKSLRQAVHSLRRGGGSVGEEERLQQPSKLPHRPRTIRISEDESRELRNEAVLLEQQLTETSTKAAKEVESSIRELSHLTNLLNEQALIQSEQLSLVAKNTEDTLSNVSKASRELQKPSTQSSFLLNPTRQLIALLWICMAFVLLAHYMVR